MMKKAPTSSSQVNSIPSIRKIGGLRVESGGSNNSTLPRISTTRRSSAPVEDSSATVLAPEYSPTRSSCPAITMNSTVTRNTDVVAPFSASEKGQLSCRIGDIDQSEDGSEIEGNEGDEMLMRMRSTSMSSFSSDSQCEIIDMRNNSGDIQYIPLLSTIGPTIPKKTFNLRGRLMNEKHSIPSGILPRSQSSIGLSDELDRRTPRYDIGELERGVVGLGGEMSVEENYYSMKKRGSFDNGFYHSSYSLCTSLSTSSVSRIRPLSVSRSFYSVSHSHRTPHHTFSTSGSSTPDICPPPHLPALSPLSPLSPLSHTPNPYITKSGQSDVTSVHRQKHAYPSFNPPSIPHPLVEKVADIGFDSDRVWGEVVGKVVKEIQREVNRRGDKSVSEIG